MKNDSRNGPHKPQVIDLFAGVGGLSLGAVRAGFELALAVELDKHAFAAHKKNFPNFKHAPNDIASLDGQALLKIAGLSRGNLDGLIGGPPCQGFSVMGHRSAVDPRNNLFVKFFDLVSHCRPKFFVAENVLGILDEQYDEIRSQAMSLVKNEYILLDPMRFRASDFGAPTSRERVFFIGYRKKKLRKLTVEAFESGKTQDQVNVRQALYGLPNLIEADWQTEEQSWRRIRPMPCSAYSRSVEGRIPERVGDSEAIRRLFEQNEVSGCFGTRHTEAVRARFQRVAAGKRDRISKAVRLNPDGLCPTLLAGTDATRGSYQAVRPIHPSESRVITPREAARLQGFPDWFQFSPTKWHSFRQIGNSVSPIVAEAVFSVLFEYMQPNRAEATHE